MTNEPRHQADGHSQLQDAELNELRRMSCIMSPEKSQPTLVKETRTVPTLDNILGSLVN